MWEGRAAVALPACPPAPAWPSTHVNDTG